VEVPEDSQWVPRAEARMYEQNIFLPEVYFYREDLGIIVAALRDLNTAVPGTSLHGPRGGRGESDRAKSRAREQE